MLYKFLNAYFRHKSRFCSTQNIHRGWLWSLSRSQRLLRWLKYLKSLVVSLVVFDFHFISLIMMLKIDQSSLVKSHLICLISSFLERNSIMIPWQRTASMSIFLLRIISIYNFLSWFKLLLIVAAANIDALVLSNLSAWRLSVRDRRLYVLLDYCWLSAFSRSRRPHLTSEILLS